MPTADVYVLMETIHDWHDVDALRILSNLRRSAPDYATVLIVETVLDDQRRRDPARTLDVVMLALTGGRERTPAASVAVDHPDGVGASGDVLDLEGGATVVIRWTASRWIGLSVDGEENSNE